MYSISNFTKDTKIIKTSTMAKTNSDQSTIPRPLNCFLLYRLEKQKEIVAKCAGANHRDISKIIAKWWQESSEEEKNPFRERARIAKQEHHKLYPDYKYTPKKKVNPKRVYIRRNKKEQFTSRAQENNKFMEMIYEDPTALESITNKQLSPVTTPATVSNAAAKKQASKTKITKRPVICEREFFPIGIKTEDDDYTSCLYEATRQKNGFYRRNSQQQFASQLSPMSTFSSTPQVSPYTECYSESDMASPGIDSASFDAGYFKLAEDRSVSSFSMLDIPFINEFDAYGCQEAGLSDNFYLNPFDSITNNNNNKSTQATDVSFLFDQQSQQLFNNNNGFMTMQFNPVTQYINPTLLHM